MRRPLEWTLARGCAGCERGRTAGAANASIRAFPVTKEGWYPPLSLHFVLLWRYQLKPMERSGEAFIISSMLTPGQG